MHPRLVKGAALFPRLRRYAPILEAARQEELLNEIEVTMMMGAASFLDSCTC